MGEHGGSADHVASLHDRLADFCLIADLTDTDLLASDALSGHFLACSHSAHTHLGYSIPELLALSPEAIQADPDHDAAWGAERRRELIVAGGGTLHTRHRCRDDSIRDVIVRSRVLEIDGRQLIVSCVSDETQQRHREMQLADTLSLLEEGTTISGIGVWDLRFSDGRMRWSEQTRRLCRSPHGGDHPSLRDYGALVHPDDRLRWHMDVRRAVTRGDVFRSCHRLCFEDGTEVMVEAVGQLSYDHSGAPARMVGTLRDITGEQALLQAVAGERSCDPLTGLPNKLATLEELDRRLSGRRYNASMAVMSLDVDGFGDINDHFGSDVGDRVLRAMAGRLRDLIGPGDWLARLGSDQFLILMEEGVRSIGDAMGAARRLQQEWAQQQPLLEALPLDPTFSVGIATYPEHAQESRTLIQCANTALMKGKAQGSTQVCAYSSTISRQIQERMELSIQLSQAVEREQFRLLIQPQRTASNALAGGEILLRWTNHLSLSVPPSHFLPLAEESGLILQLSPWVLRQTAQRISAWQAAGLHPPRLALNVSPRELELPDGRFIGAMLETLAEHQLRPEQLELEITETALIRNPLLAREQLRVLADQGFRIAIDNFGTGYSSLELLRTLPVHRLKIDRTFVQALTTSPVDQTIVATTIALAHGLGMDCTAEGVETEEQRRKLQDLGCDCFQGFLCGPPLEPEAFEALLLHPGSAVVPAPERWSGAPQGSAAPSGRPAAGAHLPGTFEQLALLRTAVDASRDFFLLLQSVHGHDGSIEDFRVLDVNRAVCSHLQQDREAILGQTLLAISPSMVQNGLMELYGDAAMRNVPTAVSGFAADDGPTATGRRLFDIEITPDRGILAVTWRDVTEQDHAARSLADVAALYRLLADNIVDVMLLLNHHQQVVWVSPSLQPMTGWQQTQWHGRSFQDLFASAEEPPGPVDLDQWLAESGPIRQGRLRLADPDGDWGWVQLNVRRLACDQLRSLDTRGFDTSGEVDPIGAPLSLAHGYVITLQPVDAQVLEERLLLQRANTDALTGLCSRAAILERLERLLLDERAHSAQPLALLFCDCDGFKGINDRYGHACGDAVLRTVARRIQARTRRGDHAGRIGGDEFLLLLEGIEQLEDAIAFAEDLQTSISEPIPWSDRTIEPSFSIGIALHGAGEDADLFLRRADRNMYTAKAAGRRRVVAL
ncbi:diguanylate cyclase [Cyanobium sp. Candia 9D4]|uniref:bifunctional diguanylate cyclase/phosphodiesterase n=1 Tax=Cyanobium sp. Candia 9D4 TaxID=2823707 RepID=UPI0020CF2D2E|nr:diguanylate cyclase [Cyanobium sp. Candia 9D4]MCP9933040.1 diguanylate cyclase [Cyanobium sp. Candia 9D4]